MLILRTVFNFQSGSHQPRSHIYFLAGSTLGHSATWGTVQRFFLPCFNITKVWGLRHSKHGSFSFILKWFCLYYFFINTSASQKHGLVTFVYQFCGFLGQSNWKAQMKVLKAIQRTGSVLWSTPLTWLVCLWHSHKWWYRFVTSSKYGSLRSEKSENPGR